MKRTAVLASILCSCLAVLAWAQATISVPLKDKYHVVEVEKFSVQEGLQFPPEYVQSLQNEIVKQFGSAKIFAQILLPGQSPTDASASTLRLTGTVTYFDPGNRGKRYIGFGLGAGQIVVQVAYRDPSSGATLISDQITATLSGGVFGGDAAGINREFAKSLATTTKLLLEKPAPAPGESSTPETTTFPAPSADHKMVTIAGGKFDQAQVDLNAVSAAGYRLVAFNPKGTKTADATMEPSTTPPQVYQYRVLHVQWLTHLQKDMNQAALDGYRYCPQTLAQFGGAVAFAIVEKPPVPRTRYEYRMHAAMQLSNAQKDIAKDQRDNFVLVDTLDLGGLHVVLTEKAMNQASE